MSLASFVFHQLIVYSNRFLGQLWESPQIHVVESLATAMVALQVMQFVLYHARLRANHWSVSWVAWAVYYLPVPVAVMAVATMMLRFRYPPPYWLVGIFFAAGQADTMAAYSLLRGGDKGSVRRLAMRALPFAYLALVLFQRGDDGATTTISSLRRKEMFSLVLGFLAVLQDLKMRSRAMVPPPEICEFAADHVRFEAQGRRWRAASPFADEYDDDDEPQQDRPSVVAVGSLESYRSAVSGCSTLQDIRTRSCSRRLEDACLSSALFLELLQRYGHGYGGRPPPPHVAKRSSANRAFTDVLADADNWLWGWDDRAFKIVEVQLSFMKDYFFSEYGGGSPSCTSYRLYVVYSLLKISFLLCVVSLVAEEKKETARRSTSASLYALLVLQLCQFFGYLNSDRFLVSYMCHRRGDLTNIVDAAPLSSRDSIFVAIPMFIFEVVVGHKPKAPLGHYSLVEDFDGTCLMQRLMARLLRRQRPQMQRGTQFTPSNQCKLIKKSISSGDMSSQFNRLKRWICDKAADDSESSAELRLRRRRFLFDDQSLWVCDSLDFRVAWTLKQETRIHTILIWHIATWFCDMSFEDVKFLFIEMLVPEAYTFATMLSSYCAYVVAKCPELLHEHPSLTRSVLDQVLKEAQRCFEAGTSSEERYEMLKNWRLELMIDYPSHFPRLLSQGIRLGHQLMIYSSSERWKIMADFWAEMVLFVAGSGNAAAHIEHLARGDEFITQLWALLSNVWDRTSIRRNNNVGDSTDDFVRRGFGILYELFEALD